MTDLKKVQRKLNKIGSQIKEVSRSGDEEKRKKLLKRYNTLLVEKYDIKNKRHAKV